MSILLTVPHYKCVDKNNKPHYCDAIAGESADKIKSNNDNFIIIKGNIIRNECDLNRIECRYNTNFRKKIREVLKEKINFVLDIHSFPNESNPDLEMYILDDYTKSETVYCLGLYCYLLGANIRCGYNQGEHNDVMDETRELGFKSLLLEFNESLEKKRLKEICLIINKYFINKYFIGNYTEKEELINVKFIKKSNKYDLHNSKLLNEIFIDRKYENNSIISTYSILSVMLEVFYGSSGKVEKEFENIFGFERKDIKPLDIITSKDNEMISINGMWINKKFIIKESFISFLKDIFKNEIQYLDTNDLKKQEIEINKWAAKNTKDTIKELIPKNSLDKNTLMILANALYFKGIWNEEFNKENTKEEDFKVLSWNNEQKMAFETIKYPLMYQKEMKINYEKKDSYEIGCLPYKGNDFYMCFIKCTKHHLEHLIEMVVNFKETDLPLEIKYEDEINVKIPKMKIENKIELSKYYKNIGLESAFKVGDDFKNITKDDLFISFIQHNTFLDIDEKGTVFSATTSVGIVSKLLILKDEAVMVFFNINRSLIMNLNNFLLMSLLD